MEVKHTPTPWAYIPTEGDEEAYGGVGATPFLITSTCDLRWNLAAVIGDVPDLPAEANAAFIARAVNSHDDLVGAADEALNVLIGCCIPMHGDDDRNAILSVQQQLRVALAKATSPD